MIETTVKIVDGIQFYTNIRILEPDEIINGVGIHRIDDRTAKREPELLWAIKALGLRKVGHALSYRCDLYAMYPIPYWRFKTIELLLKVYWVIIRVLYDDFRVFKAIPPGIRFSWAYFTPYVWYQVIRRRIHDRCSASQPER